MSMPEQANPPGFMDELPVVVEEEEVDSKLAEFLRDLRLEKYLQVSYSRRRVRESCGIISFADLNYLSCPNFSCFRCRRLIWSP